MCRALLYASESLPVSSRMVSFNRHSSTVAHYTYGLLVVLPFSSVTRRSNALSLASRSSKCRHLSTHLLTCTRIYCIYVLQHVVEGLHMHVCVDTCTLEFNVEVHSIDVI